MKLVNPVRQMVDGVRQDHRETVPEQLEANFGKKPTKAQWTSLFNGMGKTDILSMGREAAIELMKDPGSLPAKIAAAKAEVVRLGGVHAVKYQSKAEALAIYMTSGRKTSENLLRNAYAIAHLPQEGGPSKGSVKPELIRAIDDLVSLLAYEKTDAETKTALKELAETEAEGMFMLLGFHAAMREALLRPASSKAAALP